MSDEVKKEHWAKVDANRKRFWAEARTIGYDNDSVHEVLKVTSLYDWTGTGKEALECLKAHKRAASARAAAERRDANAEDEPRLQGAVSSFPSLPVWASTEFVDPSGHRWKFSIAAGLQSDLRIMALDQVQDGVAEFTEMAACHGWKPVNGYRAPRPQQPARPAQATQAPAPSSGEPKTHTPPPPPGQGTGAPPPPPTGAAGPPAPVEQAQIGGGEFMTEFVKIVAPKGKPVIEFWRPNRKWAEIKYHLGGVRFLELAPELAKASWVAAHFDDVGKEYPLLLTIVWEPSQDGKYKDITAVRLRQ